MQKIDVVAQETPDEYTVGLLAAIGRTFKEISRHLRVGQAMNKEEQSIPIYRTNR